MQTCSTQTCRADKWCRHSVQTCGADIRCRHAQQTCGVNDICCRRRAPLHVYRRVARAAPRPPARILSNLTDYVAEPTGAARKEMNRRKRTLAGVVGDDRPSPAEAAADANWTSSRQSVGGNKPPKTRARTTMFIRRICRSTPIFQQVPPCPFARPSVRPTASPPPLQSLLPGVQVLFANPTSCGGGSMKRSAD